MPARRLSPHPARPARALPFGRSFGLPLGLPLGLALLAALAAPAAQADGRGRDLAGAPAAYTSECGACHVAYPAGMLPKASWTRVMAGLERHYGVDATLDDAKLAAQISAYLQREGGSYKRVAEAPPEDRLTRSAWFDRKHRELRAEVWKRASVKSPANCAACHQGAERGDYDDDNVRIPR